MLPHQFHPLKFIHFKSRKDLPHLGTVVLLTVGIIVGVFLALQPQTFRNRAAEGALVDLRFEPGSLQLEYGKIYEAKIILNPKAQRITAADLKIGYNPKSISIIKAENGGFLPVELKNEDHFDGNLNLIYSSTIDTVTDKPGTLVTLKFKVLGSSNSEITVKPGSGIAVSSQEGNALSEFPKLSLLVAQNRAQPGASVNRKFPNNLLEEPVILPESPPTIRDFTDSIQPKPQIKPERVGPEFSLAFVKQLGRDIFIEPVVALNQVIEQQARNVLGK